MLAADGWSHAGSMAHGVAVRLRGRFRLSVTTDARAIFADGLRENSDVTVNWILLWGLVVQGPTGMTCMALPDDSVLAGGIVPGQAVYYVAAVTT